MMSLVTAVWFALSTAGEAKQYQKPGMKPVLCNLLASPRLSAVEKEGKYEILCAYIKYICIHAKYYVCKDAVFKVFALGQVFLFCGLLSWNVPDCSRAGWTPGQMCFTLWANGSWVSRSLFSFEFLLQCTAIHFKLQLETGIGAWRSTVFMLFRKLTWIHFLTNVAAFL